MARLLVTAIDERAHGITRRNAVSIERGVVAKLIPLTIDMSGGSYDISAPHVLRDPRYIPEVGDTVIAIPIATGEWYISPAEEG